ncbi:retrovirus-related pol polyprotein from transposon TNT 1-94 [Tanacetum coccineum]
MLSSTGVKPSTSASRSRHSGNTKKDKIQQTPSSTQMNKVEAQPRKVKSSLKKKNVVIFAPKGTAKVQLCVLDFINNVNARVKSKSAKKNSKKKFGNQQERITTTIEVSLRKPTTLNKETPKPVVTLVYSRKPRTSKTNISVSKSKVVPKLFSDWECYDFKGLLRGRNWTQLILHWAILSRGNNMYTLSLGDMMASSPICLLSKASKTKSWLWHRRLSHLNFGVINHLARHGLVRGLPKLKFEKDHLCSACAISKSKKKPHKPKSEDTNQEKLYLLTWIICLRSKDEAPDFIIKFLNMIQVRLQMPVRQIKTDNGTEFVNQTYYEKVDISHETSVARSPQQNGVVERRNHTLIEAAHIMLIYAKALLFLWAEAVATACYTQNRSIIRRRHRKTPYELLHDKLPD